MRIIAKILYWVIGIGLLLAIIGFLLPKQVYVERTALINTPPDKVYALVNDLKTYDQWMPWNQIDPTMKKLMDCKPPETVHGTGGKATTAK